MNQGFVAYRRLKSLLHREVEGPPLHHGIVVPHGKCRSCAKGKCGNSTSLSKEKRRCILLQVHHTKGGPKDTYAEIAYCRFLF